MRLPVATLLSLVLSTLFLDSSQAFGLSSRRATRKSSRQAAPSFLFQSQWTRTESTTMVEPKIPHQRGGATSLAMGFVGKSGLLLLSIFLVKLVYAVFFPSDEKVDPMSRCPWPFIVFHDPKQFLKDSPTWMIVTYVVLLRLSKKIATGVPA